jgi:hypothetical protein
MLLPNLLMPKLKPLEHSSEELEISLSFYLGYPMFLPNQQNSTTFTTDPLYFKRLRGLKQKSIPIFYIRYFGRKKESFPLDKAKNLQLYYYN